MKNQILILLFFTFISNAQTDKIDKEIQKINNKDLIEIFQKQSNSFNELESYLTSMSTKEISEQNDSIISLKFKTLLNFYIDLDNNHYNFFKIKKSKKEEALFTEYMNAHLAIIDPIYSTFLINLKLGDKIDLKNITNISIINNSDKINSPVLESCLGTELEKEKCTKNYIYTQVMHYFSNPSLRSINHDQLKIYLQFLINKNGKIISPYILKSSNYFEYDMEAIKVFEKYLSKSTFLPATKNNEKVTCKYAIPVIIPASEEE